MWLVNQHLSFNEAHICSSVWDLSYYKHCWTVESTSTNNLHNSLLNGEICKRYALFVPTVVVNKVAIGLVLDLCPDTLFT